MNNKTVIIEGMGCAACAAAIETALRKLPGISAANVNLASEKLSVSCDPKLLNMVQIESAVEKAGYNVVAEPKRTDDGEQKRNEILQLKNGLFGRLFLRHRCLLWQWSSCIRLSRLRQFNCCCVRPS